MLALAVLLVVGYGGALLPGAGSTVGRPSASPTPNVDADGSGVPSASPAAPAAERRGPFPVLAVVDGATIRVAEAPGRTTTVRLLGVDAPVLSDRGLQTNCLAAAATGALTSMLTGREVRLQRDLEQEATDGEGRTLAYVYVDATLVNQVLLQGGYVVEYADRRPYRLEGRFRAAEQAARDAKLGVWAPGRCASVSSPTAGAAARRPGRRREILTGMPAAPSGPAPLTLVIGDEDLLVGRAIAEVVVAAKAVDAETTSEEYAAGGFTADAVLDLRNPPLFGGTRVVVVRGLNELPDDVLEAFLAVASQPIPEVVLVGTASGRERRQVAALKKLPGTVVRSAAKITRPKERRLFLADEAKRVGIRLTDAAIWALLDAVGADLRALSGAVDQLREVAAAGKRNPRAPLDEDDVGRLFRGRAETRGFAVADAVVAGDTAGALGLLRSAVETGLDPVPIVSVIASSLRDLARVSGELSSGRSVPRAELARRLGMPDWKVDKIAGSARQWSDAALAVALQSAAAADAGVKGAAADPVFVVERLVLEATSARNGRPALAAGGVRR